MIWSGDPLTAPMLIGLHLNSVATRTVNDAARSGRAAFSFGDDL